MAAPIQHVQPIPNGSIPIMGGAPGGVVPGVVQQGIVYQQQPAVVMAGAPQMGYTPRKPYVPRERHPNEEQCKIFVGAVGKDTTDESLRAYFGKFGEIADSVIMTNKMTGQPRGFAFVTFTNADAVQAVIDQNNKGGHTLDGKVYLQVRKYFPKAEYDAEKATMGVNPGSANPQYKGPMKISPELKIFVGGIGIGTTEEDVRKYFQGFGTIMRVDMPRDFNTNNPRGFAFVGFETNDSDKAVTRERYHQINGKTVEVKGADEQQAHQKKKQEGPHYQHHPMSMGMGRGQKLAPSLPTGSIATVSGYGAYANLAAAQQQIVIPQNGAQYALQVPTAAAAGGGYVYDPSTNTYYQLPGAVLGGGGGFAGLGAAANPYAGMTILGGAGGQQLIASPALQGRHGGVTAEMMQGLAAGGVALGSIYPSETSTFGPQRTHVLGGGGQQPMSGNTVADPHVVYSTSPSISAGDVSISTPRGFHPYGR